MNNHCTCIEIWNDNEPEFFSEKIVTARKEHICCECGEVIKPGEQYESVGGKWDGEFGRYKTCIGCSRIRKCYFCGGWLYEMMWEDLINHFEEIYYNYDTGTVDDFAHLVPEKFRWMVQNIIDRSSR